MSNIIQTLAGSISTLSLYAGHAIEAAGTDDFTSRLDELITTEMATTRLLNKHAEQEGDDLYQYLRELCTSTQQTIKLLGG